MEFPALAACVVAAMAVGTGFADEPLLIFDPLPVSLSNFRRVMWRRSR